MSLAVTHGAARQDEPGPAWRLLRVHEIVESAGQLLPSHGPISAFAFLNALQALEHLPFDDALRKGSKLFGCQPYFPEERYRERMQKGRIREIDITSVLSEDLAERASLPIGPTGTLFDLRLAMLSHPVRLGSTSELRWFVAETDALLKVRPEVTVGMRERLLEETRHWVMHELSDDAVASDSLVLRHSQVLISDVLKRFGVSSIEQWTPDVWETVSLNALWRVCREGVHTVSHRPASRPPHIRPRDALLEATGSDSDTLVHEQLGKFCAAYADQGFATWTLPHRTEGFFVTFLKLYSDGGDGSTPWMKGLAAELRRIRDGGLSPAESILESLELLGISEEEWDDFLTASLLALRGWAGMIRQMEVRGDRVPTPAPMGTTVEFLAARLILERVALAFAAREHLGYSGPVQGIRTFAASRIRPIQDRADIDQQAFLAFQVAQLRGWSAPMLFKLRKRQWTELVAEIEAFHSTERRRLFHRAFERRFRNRALDALSNFSTRSAHRVENPAFQSVYCIDAREESMRRHVEEVCPQAETFGTAGFYGIPIYYRGASDAHFTALCPVVMLPKYWLVEDVACVLEKAHLRRKRTRQAIGSASRSIHLGSRTMAGGALLSATFGVLASIPMVARVLFPRLTSRIRRTFGEFVAAPPVTRLRLERTALTPGRADDQIGFTVDEMIALSEQALRDIGLTCSFARIVIFFGHGSVCQNNPHKSTYDCGACCGVGGPNARALAAMLNDSRVRQALAGRGIEIPQDTWFIGGLHNTASDSATYFDLDLLPNARRGDFENARLVMETALARNAHERCRRFESAPLTISFDNARHHVEERSEDLAQTRPEYGNATNALCIVGRRSRTRGLYLDRRAFMMSYDPTQDDADYGILGRILGSVIPVCEGINMQYFLSAIDPSGWGAGTKLPHNVTSLLGVMDGAASDLKMGLPLQSVEIHEPVRCLFVIETVPEAIQKIMTRNPAVRMIIENGWIKLALLARDSSELLVYKNGEYIPYEPQSHSIPRAASSLEWYRGWRDHLDFASVGPPEPENSISRVSEIRR